MIYLLAKKWRGAINITSMRYFADYDALKAHIGQNRPSSWDWHHVYRIYDDGRDAKALTLNENRALGLRAPKED